MCLKLIASLFRNHKTCAHLCISNLTRKNISLTKQSLSRSKSHTTMPNCGAPGCTNRSTTHPEKKFSQTLKYIKKKKNRKRKRKRKNEGIVDDKN